MTNELKHYGVLGMKWGIRRARRKQAKAAYKATTDKAFKKYEKTIANIEKPYKRGQMLSKVDQAKEHLADTEYRTAEAKAKADYKKAKKDRSHDAEIANKLYSQQSKKANKTVANMSTGMAVCQSMLLGSYGTLKYHEAKARGQSTGKAAVEGYLYYVGDNLTGGLLSMVQYLDNRAARK